MRMWIQSLAPVSGLRIQHWCELLCKSQTGLRSPVGWQIAALIHPLAWELPYAAGATLKSKNNKINKIKCCVSIYSPVTRVRTKATSYNQ